MAKNHFDLETRQRVNIRIPGYDASGEAQRQHVKVRRKWQAEKERKARAERVSRESLKVKLVNTAASVDEFDSLNKALATKNIFSDASGKMADSLLQADGNGAHAN